MPENRPAPAAAGERLLHLVDTARRQTDELRAGLEESERREFMGLLAAAIAHEVSNVLTPVRSYAEAAMARPGDAALTAKALKAAAEGSERACLIADAMLDCARGEVREDGADVAAAVRRACLLVGPPVFHVEQIVTPRLRARISQVALEQVLLNLLLNARAAVGGKPARVVIRAVELRAAWVEVSVEDNGRGIPIAKIGRVFEAFESGAARGRGLGLTICKYLVEAAGGTIRATSEVGVGSRFVVELPATDAAKKKAA